MEHLGQTMILFLLIRETAPLETDLMIDTAFELKEQSVPFFWLNGYGGGGDIGSMKNKQRSMFVHSGAKHIKIDDMTLGMNYLRKREVEGINDTHFCLPGLPNEISLLLIKIIWAEYYEKNK